MTWTSGTLTYSGKGSEPPSARVHLMSRTKAGKTACGRAISKGRGKTSRLVTANYENVNCSSCKSTKAYWAAHDCDGLHELEARTGRMSDAQAYWPPPTVGPDTIEARRARNAQDWERLAVDIDKWMVEHETSGDAQKRVEALAKLAMERTQKGLSWPTP